MEIVQGLPAAINARPTIMTIGAFDGVHLGHQHLIESIVRRANDLGSQSAVLTFDPHPDMIIHPDRGRMYLTSFEERAELIEALGVDLLIVLAFTRELMQISAYDFMAQICHAVALRELWVGWDFALGRRREGTITRLGEIGHTFGYTVHPMAPYSLNDGSPISSTRIRNVLRDGDVATAAWLLGRPFGVRGTVMRGDQRGRTIGFPTANIDVGAQHLLPADGVYVCRAEVEGQHYGAVTNIGLRPTFNSNRRTVEAYLLDFAGDIYGETVRIELLHRLRGEQKFAGIAALVAQINADVAAARRWLAEPPR